MRLKKLLLIVAIQIIAASRAHPAWVGKKLSEQFTGRRIIPVTIGDARNDGRNRIYATEMSYNRVIELTENAGLYDEKIILDAPNPSYVGKYDAPLLGLLVGDARNDGKNRLYIAYPASDNKVMMCEASFSGSSWTVAEILSGELGIAADEALSMALGPGRDDGINRLYVGFNYQITEYSWAGSSWTKSVVDLWPYNWSVEAMGYADSLSISDGRNDGKKRLYAASGGPTPGPDYQYSALSNKAIKSSFPSSNYVAFIKEYTWNSSISSWTVSEVIRYSPGGISITKIHIGDGHNDGLNRIYGRLRYSFEDTDGKTKDKIILKEITWTGSGWEEKDVIDRDRWKTLYDGYNVGFWEGNEERIYCSYLAAITDGRNDGRNRLYIDEGGAWAGGGGGTMWNPDFKPGMEATTAPRIDRPAQYIECTWNGTGWNYEAIGVDYTAGFVVGEMKPDKKKRIYSAIYEYTFAPKLAAKESAEHLVPVNNYFNPMKGQNCSIGFKLPEDGKVTLKIYTLSGELVRTLIDAYRARGNYTREWYGELDEGGTAGSGVYLVNLEAPGISATKKICVVK